LYEQEELTHYSIHLYLMRRRGRYVGVFWIRYNLE